ncbi:putative anthocyanidin 3-O-glucoside 2'''-O-xylosyltransferase [Lupinus albus]|uniref:Putative anthocyanidin 3-O-glucoside 2'''-O-xylosyltransferase n=1 Tax=Lupinus albus TaxID=3870 RepID=A0A6A4PBP0_LUPAL|nr:putative anthocyanidin 3-O-glucoside 2'''-O-xylosyltransferase [Lupinus albus]
MDSAPLHIAIYPWFSMGHLNSYLHLSNKLAKEATKSISLSPKEHKPRYNISTSTNTL